jgi:uncharacterized membrane protein YfcA
MADGKLKINKKLKFTVAGFLAGILNGLLGAGGGMVLVPMLENAGIEPAKAHATSIAVIIPLCVLSVAVYLQGKSFAVADALIYIPAGLAGAFIGAKALPKIPAVILRRMFGAFMLYSAIRLLWR